MEGLSTIVLQALCAHSLDTHNMVCRYSMYRLSLNWFVNGLRAEAEIVKFKPTHVLSVV